MQGVSRHLQTRLLAAGRRIVEVTYIQGSVCSAGGIRITDSLPYEYVQLREVKQQATEVRPGQVVEVKGKLMQIQKYQHTQGSGRQLGNVQLELRDIKSGSKHQQRCRSYDSLEVVRLEDRTFTYLYSEGSQLHFLHPQTYEQEAVDMQLFGDQHQYFVEDLEATLSFHDGEVVAGALPQQVVLSIVSTDVVAKGDEKSPQYKPAIVGAGRKIMVPPFIAPGKVFDS
ncbi:hypothetical protein ABBQ32_011982 [Trebouxia sp. C0010 RCD-2024]